MHNLMTVKETAEYLRIPLPTVYYLVQRGQLPAIQIGGRWRIKKSSLDKDILKEDQSGQPTVLVVDDDESLQNLFKLFLKKIGFSRVVVGTVKEALVNARKHSQASRVEVRLWSDEAWLRGCVLDDGRGFDLTRALDRSGMRLHLGLDAMCERLRLAGGDVSISSSPGKGARVDFAIPLGPYQG